MLHLKSKGKTRAGMKREMKTNLSIIMEEYAPNRKRKYAKKPKIDMRSGNEAQVAEENNAFKIQSKPTTLRDVPPLIKTSVNKELFSPLNSGLEKKTGWKILSSRPVVRVPKHMEWMLNRVRPPARSEENTPDGLTQHKTKASGYGSDNVFQNVIQSRWFDRTITSEKADITKKYAISEILEFMSGQSPLPTEFNQLGDSLNIGAHQSKGLENNMSTDDKSFFKNFPQENGNNIEAGEDISCLGQDGASTSSSCLSPFMNSPERNEKAPVLFPLYDNDKPKDSISSNDSMKENGAYGDLVDPIHIPNSRECANSNILSYKIGEEFTCDNKIVDLFSQGCRSECEERSLNEHINKSQFDWNERTKSVHDCATFTRAVQRPTPKRVRFHHHDENMSLFESMQFHQLNRTLGGLHIPVVPQTQQTSFQNSPFPSDRFY